jgi:hypothetical protein
MLRLLDVFYTILHLAVIFFNLFGWIPQTTRKANFIVIALTAGSWFILGIWYGMGYCFLTDWQWNVKERLGETDIPSNFIGYIVEKVFNRDFDSSLVSTVTGIGFALAVIASVYVNFILPGRKGRKLLA